MSTDGLPTPVRSETYTSEHCDGMGGLGSNELFLQSGGQVIRPRLAYPLRLASLQSGMSVLDIGCGRGEVIIRCAQAGAHLAVGLDYALVPLEIARSNIEQMAPIAQSRNSSPALKRADGKALPFCDESFDRVFMLDIVEHLHEWELQQAWAEVWRVLKRHGLLIIHTLPNRWAMDYGYKAARFFVKGLPVEPPDKRDLFHVNEQSVIRLSRSLTDGGFKSRIWLDDLMAAQADWWQRMQLRDEETQTQIYTMLQRPVWRALYLLAARFLTRLLITSDLFATAWKSDSEPDVLGKVSRAYTERIVCLLGG